MDEEPVLRVAIPTHDMRAVVPTIVELLAVGKHLQRRVHFLVMEASNIPRGRNMILHRLREQYPGDKFVPVLWVDSDIVLLSGQVDTIADAIRWADRFHRPIVANYPMADGRSMLIANAAGDHYTEAELQALPNYADVMMAGFGFLYLPEQPLDYVFHADRTGEDIYFWLENRNLHPCLAKQIRIQHRKTVLLEQRLDLVEDPRKPDTMVL